MRSLISIGLCALLIGTPVLAKGNLFEVRYVGGSLTSTVEPDDWGNSITITSAMITLHLRDGQELKINPKDIRAITHGHQTSRRTAPYLVLSSISPVFLVGMFKKKTRNYVGIVFEAEGKREGVNLQVKNDKYRAVLTALEAVSGLKTEEEPDE
ncbi:MAG TPA: hypothetical protein VLE19_09595 [Pyrinomonadaceae bacterium]|nr:hypothetical protein [Pyrinomonadaceae bacterium]